MITILFLAANPLNTEQLRLDEEVRQIDSVLRLAEFRDRVDLRSHWAVRVSDLQDLFLRHQPDIVHFSGHGSDASEIVLQDDEGRAVTVPARALSDLCAIFRARIRCVVLNACFSAEQAAGIAEHIDAVIGMREAVSDRAAMQFATGFYRGIGYGQDVLTAFNLGCSQLNLSRSNEAQKPQLLGKADPASVRFDVKPPAPPEAKERESAMSERPWWDQLPTPAPKIETRKTKGDVIIATVGSGARNVAVGKNIHQVITEILGEPQPDDKTVIKSQLTQVKSTLDSLNGIADAMTLQMADFQLKLLGAELTKTGEEETPSASTITQVGDWLLDSLPQIAEILTSLFATPAVGRVVGKAGEVAVAWVKTRFEK
jgi:hypothetical protein